MLAFLSGESKSKDMIWVTSTGEKNRSDHVSASAIHTFPYELLFTQSHRRSFKIICIRIARIIRILKVPSLAPQNPQKTIRRFLMAIPRFLLFFHFLLPLDVGHIHRQVSLAKRTQPVDLQPLGYAFRVEFVVAFEVLQLLTFFELDAANRAHFFFFARLVFLLGDRSDGLGREACFWLAEGAVCDFLDEEARVPGALCVNTDPDAQLCLSDGFYCCSPEPPWQLIHPSWIHIGSSVDRIPFLLICPPLILLIPVDSSGVGINRLRTDWPRRANLHVIAHEIARILDAAVMAVNLPIDAYLGMRVQFGQFHLVVAVDAGNALIDIVVLGSRRFWFFGVGFRRHDRLLLNLLRLLLLDLTLPLVEVQPTDINVLLALLTLELPDGTRIIVIHF